MSTEPVKIVPLKKRVQRIRGLSLNKEVLNDITACEFALQLESSSGGDKVDYDALIARLDRSLANLRKRLSEGAGETEISLETRILNLRDQLSEIGERVNRGEEGNIEMAATPRPEVDGGSDAEEKVPKIKILIREDGSVDWDEALESSRAVASFGIELWERLNGKKEEEGIPSFGELMGNAQVKEPELQTEETLKLQEYVESVSRSVDQIKSAIEDMRGRTRAAGVSGSPISPSDLQHLRQLEVKAQNAGKLLTLCRLDFDLERICVYLEKDIADTASTDMVDQRLIIAEVALIDRQVTALTSGTDITGDFLAAITSSGVDGVSLIESDENTDRLNGLMSLIDDDELEIVALAVSDLKNRLGIDTSSLQKVDWGSLGVLLDDTFSKVKEGMSFYGDGSKMLVADIQYGWRLILKAALEGYTLKPREVNTMRRTGKDLLTLVPFTIILIIPLTPIGHVVVFSFIQRFFPNFFPSCYTEKRLNLGRLYGEIERKDYGEQVGFARRSNGVDGVDSEVGHGFLDRFKNLFSGLAKSALSENTN